MIRHEKDRSGNDTPFERMRYYIRETGQGPKACRDLTREEAREAGNAAESRAETVWAGPRRRLTLADGPG